MTDQHDPHTAALPTPGAGPAMRMLAVAAIVASTTNPRKTFNPVKLAELAESIKASGVHQPILVRPLPAERLADTFASRRQGEPLPTHELVAGERRWRGCQLAGVADIPAMIRELSDTQVLEIQIVENLQREDVSELEEAEGYEYLMQQSGLNADQVGAKIGKSRSYVYARLKLTALCQDARAALREGQIDASKALYLARIPSEVQQIKALKEVVAADFYGETMSARAVQRHVQDNYMLRLDKAVWPITSADLLPRAGSCSDCPKRTGANPDLFADVDSADMCTDPLCYRAKDEAHQARQLAQAIERGQEVISGREAKALMPSAYSTHVDGYLRLDDKSDSPSDVPLRKLIGKAMEQAGIQPTLVANPHNDGELVAVLRAEQVAQLLAQAGHAEAEDKLAKQAASSAKHAQDLAQQDAKKRYEQGWRDALLQECAEKISADDPDLVHGRLLRVHLAQRDVAGLNNDQAKRLAQLFDLGKVAPRDAIRDMVDGLDFPENVSFAIAALRAAEYSPWYDEQHTDSEPSKALILLADALDIRADVTKAQTQANIRAQELAEKQRKAVQSAVPQSASTPSPAAHASGTREAGAQRGKVKTGPAAHARAAAPKTSKEEASAAIAAALNATGSHDEAPAAQGNEAPPVAGAQATPPTVTVKRAKPTAPPADTPDAGAQAPAAAPGQGGADAETGAALSAGRLAIGAQVKVLATATGPKQAPHVGKLGTIQRQVGPSAWDVALPREKRSVPMFVAFDASELEVML